MKINGEDKGESNVVKLHKDMPEPQTVVVHHAMLRDMSQHPELEHFQIVCHWKDGRTSTGWSDGIHSHVMAMGCMTLEYTTQHAVFAHTAL